MTKRPRLYELYEKEIIPALMKEFNYKSVMQVPKLEKIVVSITTGEAIHDIKVLDHMINDLRWITGRQPVICRAKRSVAAFRLRKGMPIGVKVTLRKNIMYEFFDRLVNIALPRVKDFRGLPVDAFDGHGNYSIGIKEQIIFPEIKYDDIDKIRGLGVVIVTTAKTDKEAMSLLSRLGVPFKREAVK